MIEDPIVEEVRRASDELIKRHGGFDGWFKHLQAMDRERAPKAKLRTVKKIASNGKKGRTRAARSRTNRAVKHG